MLLLLLAIAACEPAPPAVDKRQLVEARSEEADLLEALGYVDGTIDPEAEKRGVLVRNGSAAAPGLTLVYSRTQQSAQLITLEGEVVHRWAHATEAAWQHVELDPETGGVLVLMKDVGLVALDVDGNVRWECAGRYHHDLWVAEDGRIHALARRAVRMPELHGDLDILEDLVHVLSPEGELLEEWSVLGALRASPHAYLLPDLGEVTPKKGKATDIDLLHTNHVQIVDAARAADSAFDAGDVLLSLRNTSTVMVLDGDTRAVKWVYGPGNLTFQHHPVLLPGGNVLLFDNGRDKRSRVVEVEPATHRIVWRYGGPPRFYSKTRGSVQRLDNGNTLITISDTGYVREVTPGGVTVWEYANPDVDGKGVRGALWRATRYSPGSLPFLSSGGIQR